MALLKLPEPPRTFPARPRNSSCRVHKTPTSSPHPRSPATLGSATRHPKFPSGRRRKGQKLPLTLLKSEERWREEKTERMKRAGPGALLYSRPSSILEVRQPLTIPASLFIHPNPYFLAVCVAWNLHFASLPVITTLVLPRHGLAWR